MRTVEEVFALVDEMRTPVVSQLIHYLGPRGGDHVRRTARYDELLDAIYEDRIFRCGCCGQMVSYGELEDWACNWEDETDGLICSECYEDSMGEDL